MCKSTPIIKDFCETGGHGALPLRDVPQTPQEVTPASSPWPKHTAVFQESNGPCSAVTGLQEDTDMNLTIVAKCGKFVRAVLSFSFHSS